MVVSVIIPCYNAERVVGEAIQSALQQTYPHVEVIVIDDGSTDGSLDVIKSFAERIHWESGPNLGACVARNRGFELAQGEFIQFLDADDLLYPRKIERQLSVAREDVNTLVYCDAATDGPPHPHHVRKDSTDDAVIFMLRGGLQTSAPLHRRTWLERAGGFRVDLPCAQERDLHLRIAASGVLFQRLPEALCCVRPQPGSLSSNSERVLDQHSGIVWPVYRELERRGELTENRRRAFAGFLAHDARAFLRLGRSRKGTDYFQQAQMMHPGGGLDCAYGSLSRIVRRILGAAAVEAIGSLRRKSERGPERIERA